MPTGPFVLSLVAETRIYPLFIVRVGFRKYRIIAGEPIVCSKSDRPREEEIALSHAALVPTVGRNSWRILAPVVRVHADFFEVTVLWIDPSEIPAQKSAAKKHPG